jgi:hypothetical protein
MRVMSALIFLILLGSYLDEHYFAGRYMQAVARMITQISAAFLGG